MSDDGRGFNLIAWRLESERLWLADWTAMSIDEVKEGLTENGHRVADIVIVTTSATRACSLEEKGSPVVFASMSSFGWVYDEEHEAWRRPDKPDDISNADYPIVWLEKGVQVADEETGDLVGLEETGYYVERPCHFWCCPPDGPFNTKSEAKIFLSKRDRWLAW